ncbi:MAG: NAD(P)-binding domain-containing protein [Acidimicrobiia bacterium]|nr:NAD(P)-binding domain-containing protein [Acidimicrobiia bacterium]
MPRDNVVSHLAAYANSFVAPVREGVNVSSVYPGDDGRFNLSTPSGDIRARRVVLAAGSYQKPHRPVRISSLCRFMSWTLRITQTARRFHRASCS